MVQTLRQMAEEPHMPRPRILDDGPKVLPLIWPYARPCPDLEAFAESLLHVPSEPPTGLPNDQVLAAPQTRPLPTRECGRCMSNKCPAHTGGVDCGTLSGF